MLVTEPFAAVARASAAARGLPDLPIVVLPADLDDLPSGKAAEVVRARWPEVRRGWARGEDATA